MSTKPSDLQNSKLSASINERPSNDKKMAGEPAKEKSLIERNTRGEGDCAFHASLGKWDGLRYSVINIAEARTKVANAVKELVKTVTTVNDPKFKKLVEILMQVLADSRCPAELINLSQVYQQYKLEQEKVSKEAWEKLEALLKSADRKAIFELIERSSKQETLKLKFHDTLNVAGKALNEFIEKDAKLKKAFAEYNTSNEVKSLGPYLLENKQAINEYTHYLETLTRWLLPAELPLIAMANNITIEFYQYANGRNNFQGRLNEGFDLVRMRHDGFNHYERMEEVELTPLPEPLNLFKVNLLSGLTANPLSPRHKAEFNFVNAQMGDVQTDKKDSEFTGGTAPAKEEVNPLKNKPRGLDEKAVTELKTAQEELLKSLMKGSLAGTKVEAQPKAKFQSQGQKKSISVTTEEMKKVEETQPAKPSLLSDILRYFKGDESPAPNTQAKDKETKSARESVSKTLELDKSTKLEDKLKAQSKLKPGNSEILKGITVYKKTGKKQHDSDSDDEGDLKEITELMGSKSLERRNNRSLQKNLPIKDGQETGEYSGEINGQFERDGAGAFYAKSKQGAERYSFGLWQKDKLNGPGFVVEDQGASESYGQFREGQYIEGFCKRKVQENNSLEKLKAFECQYLGQVKNGQYHGYGTLIYQISGNHYRLSGLWDQGKLSEKDRNDIEASYRSHYESFEMALNAIDWQDIWNEKLQHSYINELVRLSENKKGSEFQLLADIESSKLHVELKRAAMALAKMHKTYEHASQFVTMPKPKNYFEDLKQKSFQALKTYAIRLTAEDRNDKDKHFTLSKIVGKSLAMFYGNDKKGLGELKKILAVDPLVIKLIRQLVNSANRYVVEIYPEELREKFVKENETLIGKIWADYFASMGKPSSTTTLNQEISNFIVACYDVSLDEAKIRSKLSKKDDEEKLNIRQGIVTTIQFMLENLALNQDLDNVAWCKFFGRADMNFSLMNTPQLFVEMLIKIFKDSMQTMMNNNKGSVKFKTAIEETNRSILKSLDGLAKKITKERTINYKYKFGIIIEIVNYLHQILNEKNTLDEDEIIRQLGYFVSLINASADLSVVIKLFSDYNKSLSDLHKRLIETFGRGADLLFFSKEIRGLFEIVSFVFKSTFDIKELYEEKIKVLYNLIDALNSIGQLDLKWYVKYDMIVDQDDSPGIDPAKKAKTVDGNNAIFEGAFKKVNNENCSVELLERASKLIKEGIPRRHFGLEVVVALMGSVIHAKLPKPSSANDKDQLILRAQLLRAIGLGLKHFEHQTKYSQLEQFLKDIVETFNYCLQRSETPEIMYDRMRMIDKYIYFGSSINAISVDDALKKMQDEYPDNRLDDRRKIKLKDAYELYDRTLKQYFDDSIKTPNTIIQDVVNKTKSRAKSWYFNTEAAFIASPFLKNNQTILSLLSEYLGNKPDPNKIECEAEFFWDDENLKLNVEDRLTYKNKLIPEILAGIAFVLSMSVSGLTNYSWQGYTVKSGNDHKYLKPHCIQILGLLRMLGVDAQTAEAFTHQRLENHLAQILTGQGKSWALALLAGFFSLINYEVVVACYSEYLSRRDMNDFQKFLAPFSFYRVFYKTFRDMCQAKLFVNGSDSVGSIVRKLVTGEKWTSSNMSLGKKAKEVLLFDEVDVFFSDKFGQCQSYVENVPNRYIAKAQEAIWKEIAANKLDPAHLKSIALKELNLQDDVFLKNLNLADLLDKEIQEMIHDALYIDSCRKNPADTFLDRFKIAQNGDVLVKNEGKYEKHWYYSYYNSFYYLSAVYTNNGSFEKHNSLEQNIPFENTNKATNYGYVRLSGGNISYSELPRDFKGIFGVTGTLKDLYAGEQEMLYTNSDKQKGYNFSAERNTYLPSFTGKSRLSALVEPSLAKTEAEWMKCIVEKSRAEISKGRAVLVFFKNEKLLLKFFNEHSAGVNAGRRIYITPNTIFDDRTNAITATEYYEVDKKVGLEDAGSAKTLTLLTEEYGRGVDFKASSAVNAKEGIHVIQSFYSRDIKEEIQIKGRTARNGEPGSYEQILCTEHLNKVGYVDALINATNPPSLAQRLNQRREAIYNEFCRLKLEEIKNCKDKHDNTREFFNDAISSSDTEEERIRLIKQIKAKVTL